MKKALLRTTALIAASAIGAMAAGPAAAENEKVTLQLGGYMEQWFGFTSQDDVGGATDLNGVGQNSDTEVFFVGSTTLDNGIKIGVNIQLEGNTNSDQIDESYLTIGGDFGTVYLGDENSAAYKMQYSAPDVGIGANSGDQTAWISFAGVGGTAGTFRGPFGSTYVEAARTNDIFRVSYFSPRFSGFQFGASYAPADQQDTAGSYDRDAVLHDFVAVGANFVESFNGVDVAVAGGYSQISGGTGAADPVSWSVGVNLGSAGFTVGASYAHADDDPAVGDMDGWDVGVGYSTGPWGVSVIYYHGERDGAAIVDATACGGDNDLSTAGTQGLVCTADIDTIMGSVSYSMGPGVKFVGTLGWTEIQDESVGSIGEDNDAVYFVVGPKLSF